MEVKGEDLILLLEFRKKKKHRQKQTFA